MLIWTYLHTKLFLFDFICLIKQHGLLVCRQCHISTVKVIVHLQYVADLE